jgi:hypothetical protein
MPEIPHANQDAIRFAEQIDKSLRGELSEHDALLVRAHTPVYLQNLGMPDLPMFYTQSHLRYAILPKTPTDSRRHGLSKQIVREMPILLETPAVVMRSLTQPSRVVCMLTQVDNDRLPLIAVINLNGHANYKGERLKSNFLVSYYGRSDAVNFLRRANSQGAIIAYDAKQLERLEPLSALQLLGTFSSLNNNIPPKRGKSQELKPQTRQNLADSLKARLEAKKGTLPEKSIGERKPPKRGFGR